MKFRNEPPLDLRKPSERRALLSAMDALREELPIRFRGLVGDESIDGDDLVSTDPSYPDRAVGMGPTAASAVGRAVDVAGFGFEGWSRRPARERAEILLRAADAVRADRRRLAALVCAEVGKTWAEADFDICETIDHLTYYAVAATELAGRQRLLQPAGERNEFTYTGRGVMAAITPWNFPMAIPSGIVGAGLATGNAVILKPAEQAPAVAYELVRILREAGVDADALGFLPGFGDVGKALVEHPAVATIGFTGSQAVGLGIVEACGRVRPGQRQIKRAVAEMGGKNAVIVDSDADLDEAVPGIVASAFSFAGQKCSAAERVLVHRARARTLLERLEGAVRALTIGPADRFASDVGPVIDEDARRKIESYVDLARAEGTVLTDWAALPDSGWFVPPTVATGLPDDSQVVTEEIFGPVVAVTVVSGIDEALSIVDGGAVALTGGLYSRSPAIVEYVKRHSPVGDLYVNRPVTGAMVSRQPFGGNRLSGAGYKTGNPDYLIQFCDTRVVCENTMRQGLVPELEEPEAFGDE